MIPMVGLFVLNFLLNNQGISFRDAGDRTTNCLVAHASSFHVQRNDELLLKEESHIRHIPCSIC